MINAILFHLRERNIFNSEAHEDSGLYLRELQGEFLGPGERTSWGKRSRTGIPGVSEELLPHHEAGDGVQRSRQPDAGSKSLSIKHYYVSS